MLRSSFESLKIHFWLLLLFRVNSSIFGFGSSKPSYVALYVESFSHLIREKWHGILSDLKSGFDKNFENLKILNNCISFFFKFIYRLITEFTNGKI